MIFITKSAIPSSSGQNINMTNWSEEYLEGTAKYLIYTLLGILTIGAGYLIYLIYIW